VETDYDDMNRNEVVWEFLDYSAWTGIKKRPCLLIGYKKKEFKS